MHCPKGLAALMLDEISAGLSVVSSRGGVDQPTKLYASNQLYPMHIQHVIVAIMLWCHCGAQAATLL